MRQQGAVWLAIPRRVAMLCYERAEGMGMTWEQWALGVLWRNTLRKGETNEATDHDGAAVGAGVLPAVPADAALGIAGPALLPEPKLGAG